MPANMCMFAQLGKSQINWLKLKCTITFNLPNKVHECKNMWVATFGKETHYCW